MRIKEQVCTLSQAKKLKQLGVIQGLSHIYIYFGDTGTNCDHYIVRERTTDYGDDLCVDAFTVAELGVLLGEYGLTVHKPTIGRNEARDRADDLIHMLEIGELIVDSCNERLMRAI